MFEIAVGEVGQAVLPVDVSVPCWEGLVEISVQRNGTRDAFLGKAALVSCCGVDADPDHGVAVTYAVGVCFDFMD